MNAGRFDADVVRHHWPVESGKRLNLYLGNGRCGGCFDAYGLQHAPVDEFASIRISHTWLSHADVWHRGLYGLDTLVPLVRFQWSRPLAEPHRYLQHLEIRAGALTTEYENEQFAYRLRMFTHPGEEWRDLLFVALSWRSGRPPRLILDVPPFYRSSYGEEIPGRGVPSVNGRTADIRVERGTAKGSATAAWSGPLVGRACENGIEWTLKAGKGEAFIALALGPQEIAEKGREKASKAIETGLSSLEAQARRAWAKRWGDTSLLPKVEGPVGRLAWRSLYHVLASYAPEVRAPAPPMGFTGNAWGFHFPQDLAFVHPVLMKFGHLDIASAHVAFYRERLEEQKALTRQIYNKPGVCWSWEFPIGTGAKLFEDEYGGVPNDFQFQIHNAAYPAQMAAAAAARMSDDWAREIAWPVVEESARFYFSGLVCERDGTFSLDIQPSMGQDEYGERNARNYLCALFSAESTLRSAVELGRRLRIKSEELKSWRDVLRAGLAYKRLWQPEWEVYAPHEGAQAALHAQKHPVQLNPLWLFSNIRADAATRRAYALRRLLCRVEREEHRHAGVPTGFYDGWTLYAFLLSAVRMNDRGGFEHELMEMVPSRSVDPEWITPYESSGFWRPYYTASMGLFLQAVTEASALGWLKEGDPLCR